MKRTMTGLQRAIITTILSVCGLLWAGCPSTTPGEQAPVDGGEQPPENRPALSTCSIGASCIFIANPAIRSCALLLKGQAKSVENITFAESVIGRSKHQDDQLGIVFIAQKHEPLEASKPIVAIPPDPSGKAESWAIEKIDCYDANGVLVNAPQVRLGEIKR